MIAQIWARLALIFSQGVGTLIDAKKVQCKVLDEETLDNIARVEPYGFSYRPKPGCQTYLLFPRGDRSYGVAIVIGDKRYQMDLVEGEVAIHDDEGNYVHIQRGGTIEVKAATKVLATTPLFEATGDAIINGNLLVKNGVDIKGHFTVNDVDVSEHHTHTSTAPGNPTSEVNGA
ncbi:MAG: phage baseplate assembly protein [Gallionellaceae bacterium]|jgi:phage gp45-like|nr:phage baseplate assembly protein [Gallionellaceae bacterium]